MLEYKVPYMKKKFNKYQLLTIIIIKFYIEKKVIKYKKSYC